MLVCMCVIFGYFYATRTELSSIWLTAHAIFIICLSKANILEYYQKNSASNAIRKHHSVIVDMLQSHDVLRNLTLLLIST